MSSCALAAWDRGYTVRTRYSRWASRGARRLPPARQFALTWSSPAPGRAGDVGNQNLFLYGGEAEIVDDCNGCTAPDGAGILALKGNSSTVPCCKTFGSTMWKVRIGRSW